jgi:hypothetical protein
LCGAQEAQFYAVRKWQSSLARTSSAHSKPKEQNEWIILIAAEFAAATNLSCHQAAFPVKLDFIVKSV